MQVILLEKVGRLGKVGDKVRVKRGYGRNYLLPFGKALLANSKNVVMFEERRADLEQAAAATHQAAVERAGKLANVVVTITAKAGEEGKLYGSVTNRDIAAALTAKTGVEIERRQVQMPTGPIRAVGAYDLVVQLSGDVSETVKVMIESEKIEQ